MLGNCTISHRSTQWTLWFPVFFFFPRFIWRRCHVHAKCTVWTWSLSLGETYLNALVMCCSDNFSFKSKINYSFIKRKFVFSFHNKKTTSRYIVTNLPIAYELTNTNIHIIDFIIYVIHVRMSTSAAASQAWRKWCAWITTGKLRYHISGSKKQGNRLTTI